uniref:Immunoglobulin V-set domain-containing protein n=1 Tax=Papio anubis TaxID=9555 RepID=A0A8I5NIS7_PAPAN
SVSVFAGSFSQSVLTQPPSLSASLEASARLTCTLSSGISVGGKIVYWYQQKPGSNPRYLLRYYSESKWKIFVNDLGDVGSQKEEFSYFTSQKEQ